MHNRKVIAKSEEFLRCLSGMVEPDYFLFRSYATKGTDGLSSLCSEAKVSCQGTSTRALASLTVRDGATASFRIDGSHGTATLTSSEGQRARVLVAAFVTLGLLLVCALRPRATH